MKGTVSPPDFHQGTAGSMSGRLLPVGPVCCFCRRKVRSVWFSLYYLCTHHTGNWSTMWQNDWLPSSGTRRSCRDLTPHPQGPHLLSFNTLTKMVRGFHKASQGEFYFPWEPYLPGIEKVGPHGHVALRLVVTPVERPRCPCPHFVSQQCQGLDSLGSVDSLKGKCPCPLEAPSSVGPTFVLHFVGEESCQEKGLHLGYNQHSHDPAISY